MRGQGEDGDNMLNKVAPLSESLEMLIYCIQIFVLHIRTCS